jgi:hypothetical protein
VVKAAEARVLCAQVRLPDGWTIQVVGVRPFRYRDQIKLAAFHRSMPEMGWSGYDVPGGIAFLMRRIEKETVWSGVTVTTDAEGWVRSVERVDG